MKKLLNESARPLYIQLMQRIREDIDRGKYPVGTRIPPEHKLENEYNVSRVTVRRALSELTSEGLLDRKQGKGTFVSVPRFSQDLKSVHSFHDSCAANKVTPGTKLLHVKELEADEKDITDLRLHPGDRVIETLRVRLADNIPVVVERNHFSMAYSYLSAIDLNGSLYTALRDFGVEARDATHDLSLSFATAEIADMLDVPVGFPLLELREVIYDQLGRPLHNSVQLIRGDRFVFRI